MNSEQCTWCDAEVEPDDGLRVFEPAGSRLGVFCRLEHIVPWAIQGPHWEPGEMHEPPGVDEVTECAQCGAPLGDTHVLLVRHRGEHRIPDGFCSVTHLREWAAAGGRFAAG